MEKVAIYGGSFDPWHSAHYEIVKRLSEKFDKVIVVPTTIRYYKKNENMFSFNYRYEQVKKAVSKFSNVEVSDIERDVDYDWRFLDTLRTITSGKFMKSVDDYKYYVAIGSDSFINFKTWFAWEEILKRASLVVFHRPGYEKESFPNDIPYEYIEDMDMNISSTQLRQKLNEEISAEDFEDFLSDVGWATDEYGNPLEY